MEAREMTAGNVANSLRDVRELWDNESGPRGAINTFAGGLTTDWSGSMNDTPHGPATCHGTLRPGYYCPECGTYNADGTDV